MKRIFSSVLNVALFITIVGLLSCADDSISSYHLTCECKVTVNIGFSVSHMSSQNETRTIDEGSDEQNSIKDVWLIEYDQGGNKKSLPQYFSADELATVTAAITMPEGSAKYKLVAIANTHNQDLYDALEACGTISALSELNYNFVSPESDLVMNGVAEISSGQSEISMMLYRNVAKLTLNITNLDDSGMSIKGIKIFNVASTCRYAELQPGEQAVKRMDYELQLWSDLSASNISYGAENKAAKYATLSHYLPRNMQGTVDCDKAYLKNSVAPKGATFVEIYAESADGSNLSYTFYPGKNMINNFDIEPNHAYHLDIVISDKGNPTLDSRVELIDKILDDANSHIIHYSTSLQSTPLYEFRINRINRFWKSIATTGQDKYSLSDGDEWVAEVIWQDSPEDLFYFCDETGKKKETCSHTLEGTWPENSIRLRPTGVGTGNVMVGVRKKNHDPDTDGYMWSWHLWVTDYDPDYQGGVNDSQSYYAVEGGGVHRYITNNWKTNLPAAQGCCIMDRNFGAKRVDASNKQEQIECNGMYYNLGRKDPFPDPETILYRWIKDPNKEDSDSEIIVSDLDLNANSKFVKNIYALTTIENSVNHPNWNYGNGSHWVSDYSSMGWNTYKWNAPMSGNDIFDPCPLGWSLPGSVCTFTSSFIQEEYGTRYSPYNLFFPYSRSFYINKSGYYFDSSSPSAKIILNYPSSTPFIWRIDSSGGNLFTSWRLLPTRLIRKPR